jgi:DNA-binding GntR family transcriptional regulator
VTPQPPANTRYDWVDARLQMRIAAGELRSGERVRVAELAKEWKVSPTPIREAVQRLAARGILTVTPQRGARVTPVSITEAREIYELRMQLEPQALRDSMQHADGTFLDEVRAITARYEKGVTEWRRGRLTAWEASEGHRQFHEALMSRCSSRWLLHLVRTLMDQATRYIVYTVPPAGDRTDEHAELARLVLAGRAWDAANHLEAHLATSLALLEDSLGQAAADS